MIACWVLHGTIGLACGKTAAVFVGCRVVSWLLDIEPGWRRLRGGGSLACWVRWIFGRGRWAGNCRRIGEGTAATGRPFAILRRRRLGLRGCAIFAAVCQEEKKNPARLSKFRKRAGKIMQSQTARNEHRRKPLRWFAARFQMGRLVWPAEKPRRFSSAVGTAAGRLTWSLNGGRLRDGGLLVCGAVSDGVRASGYGAGGQVRWLIGG